MIVNKKDVKLRPEVKEAWIKDLTSRKHRQVRHALKSEFNDKHVGFCCLGRLCDVYQETTNEGEWQEQEKDFYFIDGDQGTSGVYPPHAVASWALQENIEETTSDLWTKISKWNDKDLLSFEEIAERIEKEL